MSPDIVDFILSDDDCARGKPDPDGFLLALEHLGTRAEETLVFEDSFVGIEAAHRAGMSVAFVAELASRDSSERADLRFESFAIAWEWVKGRVVPGAAA